MQITTAGLVVMSFTRRLSSIPLIRFFLRSFVMFYFVSFLSSRSLPLPVTFLFFLPFFILPLSPFPSFLSASLFPSHLPLSPALSLLPHSSLPTLFSSSAVRVWSVKD